MYGRTPHQYLIFVRLEHAKSRLKTNASVNEACFDVGFESPTSFAALFKKTYGLTSSGFSAEQRRLAMERQRNPLKFIPGCITSKYNLDK